MTTLPIRDTHPEDWQPTGQDIADIHKYLRETVVGLAEEVGNEECTADAVKLLYDFCTDPFEKVKPAIIEHFTDCYNAVGGDIEGCYGKDEEFLRLLRIVLFPCRTTSSIEVESKKLPPLH